MIKVGVIGAGRWGRNILRVCSQLGVLDSICDANEAALATAAIEYPQVNLEFDGGSLLERDIDAVIVATPPMVHAELALAALDAGKHVFVEKPLAMTVDDAAMVVRAARARRLTLFVGHLMVYHPAVQRMFELIHEGAIGDVRHVRARRLAWGTLRDNENVWWSLAPHDVALVLEIFDEMPIDAVGTLPAFIRPRIADFAYADLRFSAGRSAHIETSWLDPEKSARLDVFGSNGVLRLIDSAQGAQLTLTPCGAHYDDLDRAELWREGAQPVDFTPVEPLAAEMQAFLEAARLGVRPPTDGESGLAVVKVLSMLGARSRRGVTEKVPEEIA